MRLRALPKQDANTGQLTRNGGSDPLRRTQQCPGAKTSSGNGQCYTEVRVMGIMWQDGVGGDPSDWGGRKGLSEEMRIAETRAYVTKSRWPGQGTGGSDQSEPLGGGASLAA